jgi:hypothetical protein
MCNGGLPVHVILTDCRTLVWNEVVQTKRICCGHQCRRLHADSQALPICERRECKFFSLPD